MIAASLRGIRGGVGTSATLAALAYALHAMEQKVLVVDMCPENTLGLHFNLDLTPPEGWARYTRPATLERVCLASQRRAVRAALRARDSHRTG